MTKPDFSYELSVCDKYSLVIGVDEVGRGAFAGPVVVSACALKPQFFTNNKILKEIISLGINDSKQLKPQKRQYLSLVIPDYFYCTVGESDVSQINDNGIVKATQKAARQAISKLLGQTGFHHGFLLCDAFPIPYVPKINKERQMAIIKGDQKCISIAAASIMAKVYRDRLMKNISRNFRIYRWGKNKGYGTEFHLNIIKQFGMTIWHRKQFVEGWLNHQY